MEWWDDGYIDVGVGVGSGRNDCMWLFGLVLLVFEMDVDVFVDERETYCVFMTMLIWG